MNKYFNLLSIALFIITFSDINGQTCANFHKTSKCYVFDPAEPDFKMYGQSTSGLLEIRRTFSYNVVFYGGMDYKFSVCSYDNLKPIHFVLIDKETGETLYDNETEEYNEAKLYY